MVLGAIDLELDGQRPFEAEAGAGQVALVAEDAGQLVERYGDIGMLVGAKDSLPDIQCPLETAAGADQIALHMEYAS